MVLVPLMKLTKSWSKRSQPMASTQPASATSGTAAQGFTAGAAGTAATGAAGFSTGINRI
jgi:hypothetical protein